MAVYTPSEEILDKYADVLVNFALGSGAGIKKGEVVYILCSEVAKPFYVALRRAVLKSGGTVISGYAPEGIAREYFDLATDEQLKTFHSKYYKGLIDETDHSIYIVADADKHELEGVNPKKIMMRGLAAKPYRDWRVAKENAGKFTWTIGLYGTEAMAKEAKMSLRAYWQQIIKACFLDEKDPVKKWKEVSAEIERVKEKLNKLPIESAHIKGDGVDLVVGLGKDRTWMGGSGRNIPSFELFISPDWRKTTGKISFDQPLYRYGTLVEGISLEFKDGLITKATATKNEKLLKEMIATDEGSDKIGEFSLTDGRISRITKFMGETLYDENVGGRYGNTHIAIGSAYKDSFPGDPSKVSKAKWRQMGYNDSIVHTDMVSTTKRTVVATLADGSTTTIYKEGKFTI
jgi:aminopeptidase